MFFSHSIFFFLLKRKSLLHCYKVNVTKVTLLIRFELIGAHSHSTYANMSNILTSPPPSCMHVYVLQTPFPHPSISQNFPELLNTTEQVNVYMSLFSSATLMYELQKNF